MELILNELISLILPITVELQSAIDKENKVKKAAMVLAAKFKSTAITTATEATAIAIEEISTGIANTNMEQHINKLIEAALKKQTSEKTKNSQGSKSPQTSLPKKKDKGKDKNNNKQPSKKKPKSPPKNKNKNDGNGEKVKQPKQTEEPNTKTPCQSHQNRQKQGQKRKCQNDKRRRKEERRKKREWKEKQEAKVRQEHQLTVKPYNAIVSNTKRRCTQDYGFASDPNKPPGKTSQTL
jgi:hypothetical protein